MYGRWSVNIMQIQNQLWSSTRGKAAESIGFQQGDIVKGTITEKISNQEAIVQVEGKRMKMKFDSPLGTEKEVKVQIRQVKDDMMEVKKLPGVSLNTSLQINVDTLLEGFGTVAGKQELEQYVRQRFGQGKINEEHIKIIADFWQKNSGTHETKQQSVDWVLQKKLPLKPQVLEAVHEALNGDSAFKLGRQNASMQNEKVQQRTGEVQSLVQLAMEEMSMFRPPSDSSGEEQEGGAVSAEASSEWTMGTEGVADSGNLSVHASPSTEFSSQNVIVTVVTKKMKQLAQEFQAHKKETNQLIQLLEKSIDSSKHPAAESLLETSIHKLDKAILKSDFLLYADMKTEKSMLQASTLLNQARQHLAKGELQLSLKVIQEVKSLIQQTEYKPSETKMVHYVKDELLSPKGSSVSEAVQRLERFTAPQDMTGRKVLEMVRQLGLNRETELMDALVFKDKESLKGQDVKSTILALQQKSGPEKLPQTFTSMLQQVAGQQLLNKHEGTHHMQNTFFRLPLQVGKESGDVKVFVTSKNKFDKMDWENCSIYFLLETETAGEVGISLKSINRQLDVTFKNDKEQFIDKMKPLAEKLSKAIQDIGFQVSSLQFEGLLKTAEKSGDKQAEDHLKSISAQEGFDHSI
jgi:hypothetical protein